MSKTEPNGCLGHALCMILLMGLMSGCASLGNDAGLRVAGNATGLDVSWSAAHPWAQQLGRQAAQFHLYAQYKSEQKIVEQDLGAAQGRSGEGWQFLLPERLKRVPDAGVCLFIGDTRTGSGLPVRLQGAGTHDTARFRDPAWEDAVAQATRSAEHQREVEALEASAQQLANTLVTERESLHSRGVDTAADCARISVQPQNLATLPAKSEAVIPPEQQVATVHRMCVRRARNIRRQRDDKGESLDMAEFIGKAKLDGRFEHDARLEPAADGFLRDWNAWYARTGADYVPELGAENEILPMGEVLREWLIAWIRAGQHADPEFERRLAGGLLDAYAACVEDVGKQLTVKYAEWQRARTARPLREQAYAERLREACVGDLKRIDDLAMAVTVARTKARAARDALRDDVRLAPKPINSPSTVLNEQTCVP